jgi:carbamoyltransferase
MIIIGIHDGHNSSACLLVNGEIIFVAQEERFSGRKNQESFPTLTVDYIIKNYQLNPSDIDEIAIAGTDQSCRDLMAKIFTTFSVKDYYEEMEMYWKPKLSGKPYDINYHHNLIKHEHRANSQSDLYEYPEHLLTLTGRDQLTEFNRVRTRCISKYLNIPESKIKYYDHHSCHIYYGYYSNPRKKNVTIGFTIDAFGDNRNQTVWKIENDTFELIAESKECELARVYRAVTLYLGMKPYEHEFKVMGLAPYAKKEHAEKVCEELSGLLKIEKMRVIHCDRPADIFQFIKEKFQFYRFDNVAAGVQMWLEKVALALVEDIHNETGIRNFVFSGGVAMNVKLNMLLADQVFVDDFYVGGSSSDESLSIGAAYMAAKEGCEQLKPLNHLYLGADINKVDLNNFVTEHSIEKDFNVKRGVTNKEIAKLLAEGNVVARVVGRTEFGSRALGNRSILADPGKKDVVQEINEMIKKRDFWMPFALSILDRFEDQYIENTKNIQALYMANAFLTKAENFDRIRSGTHPYDRTVRPQIVTTETNYHFYELISEFANITGTGALLNTSLNLHGLPLVNDHVQALYVFRHSGLKYLVIDDLLITK